MVLSGIAIFTPLCRPLWFIPGIAMPVGGRWWSRITAPPSSRPVAQEKRRRILQLNHAQNALHWNCLDQGRGAPATLSAWAQRALVDVDGRDAREEEKGIRDCYNASLRRILVAAMGNVGPSAAAVWPSHVRGAPRGGPWRAGSIVYCQAAAGGRHRTARGERQQAGARCEGRLEAVVAFDSPPLACCDMASGFADHVAEIYGDFICIDGNPAPCIRHTRGLLSSPLLFQRLDDGEAEPGNTPSG
jgi:hypothetical protein